MMSSVKKGHIIKFLYCSSSLHTDWYLHKLLETNVEVQGLLNCKLTVLSVWTSDAYNADYQTSFWCYLSASCICWVKYYNMHFFCLCSSQQIGLFWPSHALLSLVGCIRWWESFDLASHSCQYTRELAVVGLGDAVGLNQISHPLFWLG